MGAKIPQIDTLLAAGINPKTGLPIKMSEPSKSKANIKTQLRILDEQNAINRYKWYNLPDGLTGQLIERILYYRGQGMFFKLGDKFYFLPYTLSSPANGPALDFYGRFTNVSPIPFMGSAENNQKGKNFQWLTGLQYKPAYEVFTPSDLLEMIDKGSSMEDIEALTTNSCVLLHDYTPQQSFTNIPRQVIQDPVLDLMSDCLPFMRTALLNSTGIQGVRVANEDDASNVLEASFAINEAALRGDKFIPITSAMEIQTLTGGSTLNAEEFLLALQSLDNYRLSLYGLDNGGLFQKRSHMLEAEQKTNQSNSGLVMDDGKQLRQRFCDITNSIWGLGIWSEPNPDYEPEEDVLDMTYDREEEVADVTEPAPIQ